MSKKQKSSEEKEYQLFIKYCEKSREQFISSVFVGNYFSSVKYSCNELLICFDQLVERLQKEYEKEE